MDKLAIGILVLILLVEVAHFINSAVTFRWNERVLRDAAEQYKLERNNLRSALEVERQTIKALEQSKEFWKVHEASGDYAFSQQGIVVLPKGWREKLTVGGAP